MSVPGQYAPVAQISPCEVRLPGDQVVFRVHAVQRMFQRHITVEDVREVLETGESLEAYPNDQPYPSHSC
jgi:hypothetical protein